MEIFYINLDKDVKRRDSMERQLCILGLDYTRITGVDGRHICESELGEFYSGSRALRYQSRHLSRAEIGCALSHISVYQKVVNEGISCALILEDDVLLPEELSCSLNELEALVDVERPEVLLLSSARGDTSSASLTRFSGDYRSIPFLKGYYNSSYIITNLAAQALLKELQPVGDVADCWGRLRRYKVVDIWALSPHLIDQAQETFGSSTTDDFHHPNSLRERGMYKMRRLRCVLMDRIIAPWRRKFHPYNDVMKP